MAAPLLAGWEATGCPACEPRTRGASWAGIPRLQAGRMPAEAPISHICVAAPHNPRYAVVPLRVHRQGPRCGARGRALNDTEAPRPVLIRTFRLLFGSRSQRRLTCALT